MKAMRVLGVAVLVVMLAGLVLGTACAGKQGEPGVGIESTVDNGNGTFTITYTDGSTFTTSNLTGPQGVQGPKGDTGAQGPQGPAGELPVMQWHQYVATFTGTGTENTTPFNVPGDDFRLRYFVVGASTASYFTVMVFRQNDLPGYDLSGAIYREGFEGTIDGVEYIRDGRQQFYLEIFAANVEWTIYVDALY